MERLHVVVLLGHNVTHVVVGYLVVVPRDDPRHQGVGGLEKRVAMEELAYRSRYCSTVSHLKSFSIWRPRASAYPPLAYTSRNRLSRN
jgi:hypothetical protein